MIMLERVSHMEEKFVDFFVGIAHTVIWVTRKRSRSGMVWTQPLLQNYFWTVVHSEITRGKSENGSGKRKFSIKGLHPQLFVRNPALLKKTLNIVQVQQHPAAQMKRNTFEQLYDKIKALGEPTAKPTDKTGTTVKATKTKQKQKIKGLNWELALKTELTSKVPCVLYLDTWERNKTKEDLLGPTKYSIEEPQKPYHTSGVLHSKEPRFHSCLHKPNVYPGPGSYGTKGIPYAQMGDVTKDLRCCGVKKALMANQSRKPFQTRGDYLAPNVYFRGIAPQTIGDFLQRKVSRRGPYDLFSGNRSARNRRGWLPQTEVFDIKSPRINLESTTSRMFKMGTVSMAHTDRDAKPTGRFVCESTAHSWAPKISSTSNFYDKNFESKYSFNVKNIPFNGSCRRFDSLNARRFFKDWDVCGPGRYDIKATLGKQATCRSVGLDNGQDKSRRKSKISS
uniref:Uncharacterized protein n=1 Tax=Strigamia maritima TaxID=126957 RepID=T1JP17_STRMM